MSRVKLDDLRVGDPLPMREHTATNVSLFLYNAAIWNAHRIHYDERYSREVEGHPGIVIDGPLQGDWLCQCVLNWLGASGTLETFHYRNRRAAYLGETLRTGGRVKAIDGDRRRVELELFVENESGETVSPGGATVELFE